MNYWCVPVHHDTSVLPLTSGLCGKWKMHRIRERKNESTKWDICALFRMTWIFSLFLGHDKNLQMWSQINVAASATHSLAKQIKVIWITWGGGGGGGEQELPSFVQGSLCSLKICVAWLMLVLADGLARRIPKVRDQISIVENPNGCVQLWCVSVGERGGGGGGVWVAAAKSCCPFHLCTFTPTCFKVQSLAASQQ